MYKHKFHLGLLSASLLVSGCNSMLQQPESWKGGVRSTPAEDAPFRNVPPTPQSAQQAPSSQPRRGDPAEAWEPLPPPNEPWEPSTPAEYGQREPAVRSYPYPQRNEPLPDEQVAISRPAYPPASQPEYPPRDYPESDYPQPDYRHVDGDRPASEAQRRSYPEPAPAPRSEPVRQSAPGSGSAPSNPAVANLMAQAAQAEAAGQTATAALHLERALRIQPSNALLWHRLARLRLNESKHGEAESLALKSASLSGGNNRLQRANWLLIAEARRKQGNSRGMRQAQQEARRYGGA